MAYAALIKLHWAPSYFLSLPEKDRIFVAAALEIHGESIRKSMDRAKKGGK